MANIVEILIKAKDEASEVIKGAGQKIKDGVSSLITLPHLAAAGAITYAVRDIMKSYGEQAESQARLGAGLKAVGIYSEELAASYGRQATAIQALTTHDDEEITNMQTMLTQMGVMPDQMEKAIKTTLDYADALGKDGVTASLEMGKANQGNMTMLGRYGVKVDETTLKNKGFNGVLDAVNEKFGGTAEAIAKNGLGPMKQFENQIGDVKEELGGQLIPSLNALLKSLVPLLPVIKNIGIVLLNVFTTAFDAIGAFGKAISLVFKGKFGEAVDVVAESGTRIDKIWKDVGNSLNATDKKTADVRVKVNAEAIEKTTKADKAAAKKKADAEKDLQDEIEELKADADKREEVRITQSVEKYREAKVDEGKIDELVALKKEEMRKDQVIRETAKNMELLAGSGDLLAALLQGQIDAAGKESKKGKDLAKAKILVEQGVAIAKIWASVAGAGPLAPILAAVQTGLVVTQIVSQVHAIEALAGGGIVTGPTLALIGEEGPELVIPLKGGSVASMGIGGNAPINITIQFPNVTSFQDWYDANPALLKNVTKNKLVPIFRELKQEGVTW